MENPKNQIIEKIKESDDVLITVSNNPSVDQLSAAIGLTLLVNKFGKHATAVFSGSVPSTLEFLKPEETIEKDTDSLRDFIIALDKSKADKLRYKVEDKLVKIFITPYRTSIGQEDLEFSQGDFNVDLVIGLGVRIREELDQAITAHGRILHDAVVASITTEAGNLGSINWVDPNASSLSEMVVSMSDLLKTGLLDEQISNALLTGIVAETDRFSNAKTTSNTMSASAKLMSAGANQQLVATKLQEPQPLPEENSVQDDKGKTSANNNGALQINHDDKQEELPEPHSDQIGIDEYGNLQPPPSSKIRPDLSKAPLDDHDGRLVMEPPTLGGKLTANAEPENLDPSIDPLAIKPLTPILSHDSGPAKMPEEEAKVPDLPVAEQLAATPQALPPDQSVPEDHTLSEIEAAVDSPHIDTTQQPTAVAPPTPDLNQARNAVEAAVAQSPEPPIEPLAALNAQPVDLDLGHDKPSADQPPPDIQIDPLNGELKYPGQETPAPAVPPVAPSPPPPTPQPQSPSPDADSSGLPPNLVPPIPNVADPTAPSISNPAAPPPVPPPPLPMPPWPPSGQQPGTNQQPGENPLVPPVL